MKEMIDLIKKVAICDVGCSDEGTNSCELKNPEELAANILSLMKSIVPDKKELRKIILNLKAIQFACLSSAQEDTQNAVITMDLIAQKNLKKAIEILEEL